MKGKWAQGLRPRAFTWVIKDRIAAAERPGGYARNHRKVRRDEELIWLKQNGFTHVLSLLDSPHNLTAYEEFDLRYAHVPLGRPGNEPEHLGDIYQVLLRWWQNPDELILVHHEEFGDRLCGVVGGFLLAAGLLEDAPTAVTVTERLTGRQLGPDGRAIVRATIEEGLAPKAKLIEPTPLPEPEKAPAPKPSRSAKKKPASKKSGAAAKKKGSGKKGSSKKKSSGTKKKPASKKSGASASKKGSGKKGSSKKKSSGTKKKPASKKSGASASKKGSGKKGSSKKKSSGTKKKPASKKSGGSAKKKAKKKGSGKKGSSKKKSSGTKKK